MTGCGGPSAPEGGAGGRDLELAVVVPVRDGAAHLGACLDALAPALEGLAAEVVVVDDGSRDGSAALARARGARVLPSGGEGLGPAAARNAGVAATAAPVVVFVDADVEVHPGALRRLRAAVADGGFDAAYGSYDDAPSARNLASLYMNLRHHHGHRLATDDSGTFWSGLGAVRREAFLAAGGFDAARFPVPSVEDVDLGRRLRAAGGRIRRDPGALGKHRKRWTFSSVVRTDIVCRAWPWSRMMIEHPGALRELNAAPAEQLRALVALALLASLLLALAGWAPWWAPLGPLVAALLLGAPLLRVLARGAGWPRALVLMLFHQLHLVYAALTFVLRRLTLRAPRAGSEVSAGRPG